MPIILPVQRRRKNRIGRANENILAIWKIVRWFDNARWNKEEAGSNIIPGEIFCRLNNADKILTHWLAYITDQQRPYGDVWEKGGRIFSEIVEKYKEGGNPLVLLRRFSEHNMSGRRVDTLFSKKQTLEGKRIEYTPRYGIHILSIARTLYILRHFNRNIIEYLSKYWRFIDDGRNPSADSRVLRIAYLLYLLSYEDIETGIVSFHKGQNKLLSNLSSVPTLAE